MCWRNPIGITVWFQFGKLSTNFRTIAAKSERTSNRNGQTQRTAKLDRSMEPANLPRLLHTARRVTLFSQRTSQQQQWHYYGWMTFYRISLAVDRGNANGNGKESHSFFFCGGGEARELYEGLKIQFHFTIRRTSFANLRVRRDVAVDGFAFVSMKFVDYFFCNLLPIAKVQQWT